MEKVIKVENLTRTFKQYKKQPGLAGSLRSVFRREYFEIEAVKNISFEIEPGEMVGFIGPNGAGKTTTLKMLSGVLYPSSGEVSVLGHKPFLREKEFQKRFALVMGQKSQLWWELPAIEGFLLNKEIYEVPEKQFTDMVTELSRILEIEEILNIPVKKLSLGQRMKCELLAALIHRPEILFLDEPTIGLDVVVQKKIRTFFKEYNSDRKTTLILTSHYMDDVEELCERIIIINHGRIIFDGKLTEIMTKYAQNKELKLTFHEEIAKADLAKFGTVLSYENKGLNTTISVPRAEHTKVASAILQKYEVDDLDIAETSLEDVIANIFQEKE